MRPGGRWSIRWCWALTACRVGNAMYPDHYDRGWHITGSTGMLGAAVAARACSGLMLTARRWRWASRRRRRSGCASSLAP